MKILCIIKFHACICSLMQSHACTHLDNAWGSSLWFAPSLPRNLCLRAQVLGLCSYDCDTVSHYCSWQCMQSTRSTGSNHHVLWGRGGNMPYLLMNFNAMHILSHACKLHQSSWITFETQWRMHTVTASYECMQHACSVQYTCDLPGQKWVLQSLISTKFPVQSNEAAPSVLHCLIRLCLPPPHSREHSVHGDQSDQELGLGRLSSVTLFRESSSGPTPKLSWLRYSHVSQHTPGSLYGGLPSSHISILSQIVETIWIFWPVCRGKKINNR